MSTTRFIRIREDESGVRVEYENETGTEPLAAKEFPGVTLDQVSAVIVIGKKDRQNVIPMQVQSASFIIDFSKNEVCESPRCKIEILCPRKPANAGRCSAKK
jgi:hypothetical protein